MRISSKTFLQATIIDIALGYLCLFFQKSDLALLICFSGVLHFVMYFIRKKQEEK